MKYFIKEIEEYLDDVTTRHEIVFGMMKDIIKLIGKNVVPQISNRLVSISCDRYIDMKKVQKRKFKKF